MLSRRVYLDANLQPGAVLPLPEAAAHHLLKVLRMREGDAVEVFDGRGRSAPARVQRGRVLIGDAVTASPPVRCAFMLGQSVSDRERMEYAVQKSVELGVAEFVPLLTERTRWSLRGERVQRRVVHWQRIAISACEQSGNNHLPEISAPRPLRDWIESLQVNLRLVLEPGSTGLPGLKSEPTRVALAVGPVGGWAEGELEQLRAEGFIALGLGPRVLRTETAPVVALTLLQWSWGDLRPPQ